MKRSVRDDNSPNVNGETKDRIVTAYVVAAVVWRVYPLGIGLSCNLTFFGANTASVNFDSSPGEKVHGTST